MSDTQSLDPSELTESLWPAHPQYVRPMPFNIFCLPEYRKFYGPFRFLDLPNELRVEVYSYILPYDRCIWFEKVLPGLGADGWFTHTGSKEQVRLWRLPWAEQMRLGVTGYGCFDMVIMKRRFRLGTGLFSILVVNKFIAQEVRAVLYGSNTFLFRISGQQHKPASFQSPFIFGALGVPHRLHLLRDLRRVDLELLVDDLSSWVAKRHRARLEYFVNIIKQHADDKNQKSLLKSLRVRLTRNVPVSELPADFYPRGYWGPRVLHPPLELVEHNKDYVFSLESLAALRGIGDVNITGVPEWYAQCLELCIRGEGGDVAETEWPLVEVKRKTYGCKKAKFVWVTTRRWYQPTLNWKEFAERNGIEVPGDIDKYWMITD